MIRGFHHSSVSKESTWNAGDPGSIPALGRFAGEGYPLQYSWASPVTQLGKNLTALWESWVQSLDWEDFLGWEDPLEKRKATHSSILSWRMPWASLWGCKESDMTEQLSLSLMVRDVKLSCKRPSYAEIIKYINARRGEVLRHIKKKESTFALNFL